jgi:alpha-glucosidase
MSCHERVREAISGAPTRVLSAQLADYIVVARRKGDSWYLGAMTDWTPRELEVDLAFLDEGAYRMEAMRDGINAHRFAGDFKREVGQVDATSSVKIRLAPGGGWAAILTRQRP